MTDSKELVERLRRAAKPSEYRKANPDLGDTAMAVGYAYNGWMLTEAADLIERQEAALYLLDLTLCQFLNNVGDEYDPRVWLPSVRRDLQNLSEVYNACHKDGTMSLRRSVNALTNKENTDD